MWDEYKKWFISHAFSCHAFTPHCELTAAAVMPAQTLHFYKNKFHHAYEYWCVVALGMCFCLWGGFVRICGDLRILVSYSKSCDKFSIKPLQFLSLGWVSVCAQYGIRCSFSQYPWLQPNSHLPIGFLIVQKICTLTAFFLVTFFVPLTQNKTNGWRICFIW